MKRPSRITDSSSMCGGAFFGRHLIPSWRIIAMIVLSLQVGACAHQYRPPDASRLNASTGRLNKAVDSAHDEAKKARAAQQSAKADIQSAIERQKEIATEAKAIKDVPPSLIQKIAEQDATLASAAAHQAEVEQHQQQMETHFGEADKAKADVEKDKTDYFTNAKKLADTATAQSKKLAWYQLHWWGAWIVLGLGVVACILFALIKFGVITWLKL